MVLEASISDSNTYGSCSEFEQASKNTEVIVHCFVITIVL